DCDRRTVLPLPTRRSSDLTLMARLPCVGARSVTYRRSGRPETPAIHPAGRLYGWVSLPPSGWEPCVVAASWERWGDHTSAARQARAATRPDSRRHAGRRPEWGRAGDGAGGARGPSWPRWRPPCWAWRAARPWGVTPRHRPARGRSGGARRRAPRPCGTPARRPWRPSVTPSPPVSTPAGC